MTPVACSSLHHPAVEHRCTLTEAHAQVTAALEQQRATSEILRVINPSQTDVQPVFDTIVRSAVRLCNGLFSSLFQFDGELLHSVAQPHSSARSLTGGCAMVAALT
jgi:hypothetical protein